MSVGDSGAAGFDADAASHWPTRVALGTVRTAIDHVDDALVLLLALRRRLVGAVQPLKHAAGVPARDPGRERAVRRRAQRLAHRLGVPDATATSLLELLIADACRQQGLATDLDQGAATAAYAMIPRMTMIAPASDGPMRAWLRLLPPPRRFAPLLRMVPERWPRSLAAAAVAHVLALPLQRGELDFMQGKRLGIEIVDLGLRWVFELDGRHLRATSAPADATVRGSAADLLLLAGRLEDADTLFFQRALVVTGDTELGLTVRNLLERLPWESVPLGLRIALNRGGRFARATREAHRASRG